MLCVDPVTSAILSLSNIFILQRFLAKL